MSKNTEQKNNETRNNLGTAHKDGANQLDGEKYAPVEELIKRAGLEPTLENAQAIYALTNTPEYLLSGLNFEGHHLYRFSKRVFDVAASVLGMCLLSWLILGTAVAVKVTSPGPIIFKQQRVGKNKKLFNIYKFRTMRIDTPNLPSHMIDANDWLTPIGAIMRRLSLDELPQLWNILKGDMSFVGPRPPLPREVEQYNDFQRNRLSVVPGLTCYWQIQPNRNSLTFDKWLELDLKYIEERNVKTDLMIIFKTVGAVLNMEGV